MAEKTITSSDAVEEDTDANVTPCPSSSVVTATKRPDPTDRLESLKAKITCPRCHELYSEEARTPKLLPCLHHVCKPCLEAIIHPSSPKQSAELEIGSAEEATPPMASSSCFSLKCPQCDHVSHSEQGDNTKVFQTSLVMCELVDVYTLVLKCSEGEVNCERCVKEVMAVEYCYNCATFACDFCCQVHERWSGYSSHRIVPVGELRKSLEDFSLSNGKDVDCSIHHLKLRLYCETCQELICSDCTVRPHQGHSFDLITDELIVAHKTKIRQSLESLSELVELLEKQASSVRSQRECIDERVANTTEEISSAFGKVQEALDRRKTDLISQVEESAKEPRTRLGERGHYLRTLQDQISRCQEFVGECLESNSVTGILSVKQTISRHIETVVHQVKQISSVNEELSLQFRSRKELLKLASCFGRVDCHAGPLVEESSSWSSRRNSEMSCTSSLVGHSWESLSSQVLHPFCRSLFLHSEHLYINTDLELSSDSMSQDHFEFSSSSAEQSLLGSTHTERSLSISSPLKVPKFFGIAVRTIEGVRRPSGIALTSHILVTEFGQHQVSIFDYQGQKLRNYGVKGHRKGQFMFPHSIAVDQEGKLLVTDVNYRVQMLSTNGRFNKSVGSKGRGKLQFRDPTGIAIGTGPRVFVSERENHRIQILNSDLSFNTIIGKRGDGPGEFNFPSGIAVDGRGYLYVADTYNHRVQVLTEEGTFVVQFGSKGSEPGKLNYPSHVCADLDGFVYVSEIKNHRVSVFLSTGEFLMAFGLEGNKLGQLIEPRGLAIDANRMLYVCDFGNNRIQVFK